MIIATPGALDANSYLTLAEANAYHQARLHNDEWQAATEPNKEAALLWATRLLDREMWSGRRTNELQGLRWPRTGIYDQDDFWIGQDVIPQFLKNATAELAFLLLQSDRSAESGTEGFNRIKVGPIELDINNTDRVKTVSPEVYQQISYYVESSTALSRG